MPERSRWTVLTYISAHNNLDALGRRSLFEIHKVGSTRDVVHGVLYDGQAGGARYVMGDPAKVLEHQQLGRFDSGDPEGVIETARWLFSAHPAERYGLVLWSHGTGWEPAEIAAIAREARPAAATSEQESRDRAASPGSRALFRTTLREILKPERPAERAILFDDGTGHSLDTLELARVVATIAGQVGGPLEFVGMDACLMGNLEVAYELRGAARHMVASAELVPGHSWPYASVYGALAGQPGMSGADLARRVVNDYVGCYAANPPAAGDVTKVALDLARIEPLARAVDALAAALRADMASQADVLWGVQVRSRQRERREQAESRKQSKFDYHLWDLRAIAAGLAAAADATPAVRAAAAALVQQLEPGAGSVLAEGHVGAWFDGTAGLTAYLMPPREQRIAPSYASLALARDTQWDEMLAAYHAALG